MVAAPDLAALADRGLGLADLVADLVAALAVVRAAVDRAAAVDIRSTLSQHQSAERNGHFDGRTGSGKIEKLDLVEVLPEIGLLP